MLELFIIGCIVAGAYIERKILKLKIATLEAQAVSYTSGIEAYVQRRIAQAKGEIAKVEADVKKVV